MVWLSNLYSSKFNKIWNKWQKIEINTYNKKHWYKINKKQQINKCERKRNCHKCEQNQPIMGHSSHLGANKMHNLLNYPALSANSVLLFFLFSYPEREMSSNKWTKKERKHTNILYFCTFFFAASFVCFVWKIKKKVWVSCCWSQIKRSFRKSATGRMMNT